MLFIYIVSFSQTSFTRQADKFFIFDTNSIGSTTDLVWNGAETPEPSKAYAAKEDH